MHAPRTPEKGAALVIYVNRIELFNEYGIEKVFINGQLVLSDHQLDPEALRRTGRALPV